MLTESTKQAIRDKLDLIKENMPSFRSRPGQKVMIAEVAKTLSRCPDPAPEGVVQSLPAPGTTVACISGGTGIGKSLGYSLPGVILAMEKKKTLVISTATIALQDQLSSRDLPFFFKAAGINATIEIAKGRTRYVCGYRLLQASRDLSQSSMFGQEERAKDGVSGITTIEAGKIISRMIEKSNSGEWDGDRDKWETQLEDVFWSAITTDRHGCLGVNCPNLRSCAQAAARKRIKAATVVVANHDLVLNDLAMGGKIIAKPEDAFYVFDESHHLPERAVSVFASNHYLGAGKRLMEKIEAFSASAAETIGSQYINTGKNLSRWCEQLLESLTEAYSYYDSLAQLKPTKATPRPTLEFELSCIPEEFHALGTNIQAQSEAVTSLIKQTTEMIGTLLGTDKTRQPLYEKLLSDAGFLMGKAEEIHSTWSLFLEEPALDQPPIAKWVEASKRREGKIDYLVCASPVVSGGYLRKLLWEKAAGAILTSATMTSLGNFSDFLRRTGLNAYGNIPCIDLPSPFRYDEQGTIEIAQMKSSPKNYEAHTAEISGWINDLIRSNHAEGTLILFTSRRQMEDVVATLPAPLADRVLIQGTGSKAAILASHIERIDAGLPSVIMGLSSFSEGVDLAHKYLTHVVIAKLPFSQPDDPVLRTLSSWIERRGGNPFMEISVPDAARRLEQSVGRLIRTESDFGQVTVLDTRLWDTRFGKAILAGLPPFRIVAKGKEVRL